MKKAVAIGELLIDFVPQQKGCALDEVQQFERVAGGPPMLRRQSRGSAARRK